MKMESFESFEENVNMKTNSSSRENCVNETDMCRICRSQGMPGSPLYYPCACTGSMKYVHEECLMQWLKYSTNEFCEVCTHHFSFTQVYSTDVPHSNSLKDVSLVITQLIFKILKKCVWCSFILCLWLGVLPLVIAHVFTFLFSGSFGSLLKLPLFLVKTENLLSDILFGWCIIVCALLVFFGLVWLHDEIDLHGGPYWLKQQQGRLLQEMDLEDVIETEEVDETLFELPNENGEEYHENRNEENENIEDVTWTEVLGFDGSSYFFKNFKLVIVLLAVAIVIFVNLSVFDALCYISTAFYPYICGRLLFRDQLQEQGMKTPYSYFDGIQRLLSGYIILGLTFYCLSYIFSKCGLFILSWCAGLGCVAVKVFLLVVLDAVLFPVFCGLWLDVCTMTIFNRTTQDLENSLKSSPTTFGIFYWVMGFTVIYVCSCVVLLLRDIFRPGFFWFFPHLYDLEFSAVRNLIVTSVFKQVYDLFISLCVYLVITSLIIWIPSLLLSEYFPKFLPYKMQLSSELIVSDLSLEIVIIQVLLPLMFDIETPWQLLKCFITGWFSSVSSFLGIHSYFFGTSIELEQVQNKDEQDLELIKQQTAEDSNIQKYKLASFLSFRILLLLAIACFNMVLGGLAILVIPVLLGRIVLLRLFEKPDIHDAYTITCGVFIIWLSFRLVSCLSTAFQSYPQWNLFIKEVKQWLAVVCKSIIGIFLLVGVIPLLLGLFFDLAFIVPLKIPDSETPVLYVWQDWVIGVLQAKLLAIIILARPDWWLADVIQKIHCDGFNQVSLRTVCMNMVLPTVIFLVLALILPFGVSSYLAFHFELSHETRHRILRKFYPVVFTGVLVSLGIFYLVRSISRIYGKWINERYLIGRYLTNYVRENDHSDDQEHLESQNT
ncbi:E3 ubiquitin-protein ligase MARCHF6-like [Tachypleus tridentatus]|uniref:E3 ubiquitin-protein ligase MARCHF6-like n=1 Tax=Tachypleus tridentatus TaxID=6853 RepID=UPI003FD61BB0